MKPPNNVTELHRFYGIINHCKKFSPNLAEFTKQLQVLLTKNCKWHWSHQAHSDAYVTIKEEILKPTVLALYNPAAAIKISDDASSFGLGAVFLQKEDKAWLPTAFAS